ncbi:MAG: alkaline phosphatase [Planctomycetaceae bacterium]|nr:MAG: alkaline phosphatase [Planctomycetaceae bacterium]
MSIRSLRLGRVALALVLSFFAVSSAFAGPDAPKNIILLVGDGMGPEQIKAAGLYGFGKAGSLSFESMPVKGEMITSPVFSKMGNITDSAAAGTAMATGKKVINGTLSMDEDGKPMPTVLEYYQSKGKRTGLVTTSYLCDATPAAFAAHVGKRAELSDVARQLLASKIDVLFGGGAFDSGFGPDDVRKAGYETAVNRKEMLAMKPAKDKRFAAPFCNGRMPFEYLYTTKADKSYDEIPHLTEMAVKALELLDNENGFFVMIEGGNIDTAGHKNDLPANIYDTLEFDNAVRAVLKWAADRNDTLVVVTADHETGGLWIVRDNGKGKLPEVTWSSKGHTGTNVRVFAQGPGSEHIASVIDNTDIFHILKGDYKTATSRPVTSRPAPRPASTEPASQPTTATTTPSPTSIYSAE